MNSYRLLIVDDEAALADLLRRFLERSGYEVEACTAAQQALDLVASGKRFDLIVTDLTLDGMSGEDLIDRLRQTMPELPGIIASGYPHSPRTAGVEFLQKPFLPKMLLEMLAKLLPPGEAHPK